MDFAQNYTTMYQDEIKSVHYGKQQITLHPIPCYYHNEEGELVCEYVEILSDDINHDIYAVTAFMKRLVDHLRSKMIEVSHLIEWCDGAPNQYKLVHAFADISEEADKLN